MHTSPDKPVRNLNEEVHHAARGLTFRDRDAGPSGEGGEEELREKDRMTRFLDIS